MAEALPGLIVDSFRHIRATERTDLPIDGKDRSALEKVLILLRATTGSEPGSKRRMG